MYYKAFRLAKIEQKTVTNKDLLEDIAGDMSITAPTTSTSTSE